MKVSDPPLLYEDYIKTLPLYRRRLLCWSKQHDTMSLTQCIDKLQRSITRSRRLYTSTDGGVNDRLGAFGCVIANSEQPLWIGAGPKDMDPTTANSSRPEMAGYAGLWEALLMLTTVYPNIFKGAAIEVITWVDSTSALRRLRSLHSNISASRAYPADADFSSHISWLWSQVSYLRPKFEWVKAHQDTGQDYDNLTHSAKLNILANKLASEYIHQATIRPRSNPWFFPSAIVSLSVNGQRVMTKYSSSIRFHILGTQHRRFLQQRCFAWASDKVWESIDMEGLGLAYRMLDLPSRLTTSKMIHGWNNTGHQRAKIHCNSSSKCPNCDEPEETQVHILRCPAHGVQAIRYTAMMKLRSSVVTRCGSSNTWHVMITCLQHWITHGSPMDPQTLSLRYTGSFKNHIVLAIRSQTSIGWQYAFRGYVSTSWVDAYSIEHPRAQAQQLRSTWLRHVIRAIWTFGDTMWRHRNHMLHHHTSNHEVVASTNDSHIRHYYNIQDDFAASDRVLFDLSLETRLNTSLQSRKHWLVLIKRYQETTAARRMGQQNLITKFFTRPSPLNYSGENT